MGGAGFLLHPGDVDADLSPYLSLVWCVSTEESKAFLSLQQHEWGHSNAAMVAWGEHEPSLHVSVASAGGYKCADCSALYFCEGLACDACGAK